MENDLKLGTDKSERSRSAATLASLANGWKTIQDQVRILKGKPLPGSRRPPPDPKVPLKRGKPQPLAPLEPLPLKDGGLMETGDKESLS
jgi:hypothetical protein